MNDKELEYIAEKLTIDTNMSFYECLQIVRNAININVQTFGETIEALANELNKSINNNSNPKKKIHSWKKKKFYD